MVDEKSKLPKPDDRQRKPEEASKGQYGSLKGLGPGGGRDIVDATDTGELDDRDDDVETLRK